MADDRAIEKAIREETMDWMRHMNSIPTRLIEQSYRMDETAWEEVTNVIVGSSVPNIYVEDADSGKDVCYTNCVVSAITTIEGQEIAMIDCVNCLTGEASIQGYKLSYLSVKADDFLPAWGTMWSFESLFDNEWLENEDGIKKMTECGFRIYHHEEFGYFFGVDGGGYDFVEQHFIPLYKARGFQWHLNRM